MKTEKALAIHAVILAGGRGTRFWPRSRTRTPKQLLNIVGEGSMLQQTVARLLPLVPAQRIWTVTNAEQASALAKQLPTAARKHVITEPIGRNTAAAMRWPPFMCGMLQAATPCLRFFPPITTLPNLNNIARSSAPRWTKRGNRDAWLCWAYRRHMPKQASAISSARENPSPRREPRFSPSVVLRKTELALAKEYLASEISSNGACFS